MNRFLVVATTLHWVAVFFYVLATIINTYGIIFKKEKAERNSYFVAMGGLLVHGIALLCRWTTAGHGPYIVRYEVLSSNAWVVLFFFLLFSRFFPKIRPVSIFVFPSTFLLIALGLFFNPEVRKLPPTLRSVWLVLHISFYKIALATNLLACAFSVFYIMKNRTRWAWLHRLPDLESIDLLAYRFAGFGFTFWAIGLLAGSIWAYQSWGRFWAWDPVETWSLITWVFLGVHLHLRRFFGWRGERAAYFYLVCFILSLMTLFFIPLMESSIHSEYFK